MEAVGRRTAAPQRRCRPRRTARPRSRPWRSEVAEPGQQQCADRARCPGRRVDPDHVDLPEAARGPRLGRVHLGPVEAGDPSVRRPSPTRRTPRGRTTPGRSARPARRGPGRPARGAGEGRGVHPQERVVVGPDEEGPDGDARRAGRPGSGGTGSRGTAHQPQLADRAHPVRAARGRRRPGVRRGTSGERDAGERGVDGASSERPADPAAPGVREHREVELGASGAAQPVQVGEPQRAGARRRPARPPSARSASPGGRARGAAASSTEASLRASRWSCAAARRRPPGVRRRHRRRPGSSRSGRGRAG